MDYGYSKGFAGTFEDAVTNVKEELAKEGFGILTQIDVQATMKKKLDADIDRYLILGACNPPFAYRALQAEQDIGLLLPCNVIVYEKKGRVMVLAILPTVAMGMIDNPCLATIAKEVEEKLKGSMDRLQVIP